MWKEGEFQAEFVISEDEENENRASRFDLLF
jgi:hypothetical protein